jgi:hypothetical protein
MTIQELVEVIKKKPSYLKNPKRLSKRYNSDIEDCSKAIKIIKFKEKFPESTSLSFDEILEAHNLKLTDVKSVKFWQNFNGEPRYSINTKNNWHENSEEILELIKEKLSSYEPPTHSPTTIYGQSIAVINLYDAHIDKLVLIDETNPKEACVEKNCEQFEEAFNKLLSQSLVYNPEKIIFPIGNDFFNANDARNTTVKGTPQDSNPYWKRSFIEGFMMLKRCIDKARIYCKVEVPLVISNHDADKLFYLGQMLAVVYEKDEFVTIDTSTKARKYLQYGSNLLGFSHGHNEKNYLKSLPSTIMIENKSIMPEIDYIHHFCGDIHHKENYLIQSTTDLKGCTVSFLRCLSDLSKWEYEQGYVGIPKTAESYIFTKNKGLAANLLVYI